MSELKIDLTVRLYALELACWCDHSSGLTTVKEQEDRLESGDHFIFASPPPHQFWLLLHTRRRYRILTKTIGKVIVPLLVVSCLVETVQRRSEKSRDDGSIVT